MGPPTRVEPATSAQPPTSALVRTCLTIHSVNLYSEAEILLTRANDGAFDRPPFCDGRRYRRGSSNVAALMAAISRLAQ